MLKVSSDDDHCKNNHRCSVDYVLLVTPADAGAASAVDFLTSDADWDRTLSLRLDGFEHNGKRVFGVLKESGRYSSTMLFDYNTADGTVQLIDLQERFAHLVTATCKTTFDVIGTTEAGAIVVELIPRSAARPTVVG